MEEIRALPLGFRVQARDPFKLPVVVVGALHHTGQLPLLLRDPLLQPPVGPWVVWHVPIGIDIKLREGHVQPDQAQFPRGLAFRGLWDNSLRVFKHQGEIPPAVRLTGHGTVLQKPARLYFPVEAQLNRLLHFRELQHAPVQVQVWALRVGQVGGIRVFAGVLLLEPHVLFLPGEEFMGRPLKVLLDIAQGKGIHPFQPCKPRLFLIAGRRLYRVGFPLCLIAVRPVREHPVPQETGRPDVLAQEMLLLR